MKEKESIFTVNGKEYKAIFNLNVMQEIQLQYGTFKKWGDLTDGKRKKDDGSDEYVEVDISALIFGIKAMLNEAIDIDNENKTEKEPYLTDKQVGRLITEMGLMEATKKLNQTVIDSTQGDEPPKNE